MKNPRSKIRNIASGICLLAAMFAVFTRAEATQRVAKTPNEVFEKTIELKKQVISLREFLNVNTPWPEVSLFTTGITPQHVLQKSLELLDKINRLRRVMKLGPITVPSFPSREITPNEVYDMVSRLADEISSIHPTKLMDSKKMIKPKGKVPADVYRELSEI